MVVHKWRSRSLSIPLMDANPTYREEHPSKPAAPSAILETCETGIKVRHFMLKRLLVMVMPFFATSCSKEPGPKANVQMLDPKDILFTLPTLCDPAPALDDSPGGSGARSLHEDDWRQIEFVPATNYDHVRSELAALATFKEQHRRSIGWTQVYLRKEHPTPLAALGLEFASLPSLSASAVTLSGHPVRGGGGALSDGGLWFIYGQRTPGQVINLGVSPGRSGASLQFAGALVQVARTANVFLVDWYAGSLVDLSSPESALAWTRSYQRQ